MWWRRLRYLLVLTALCAFATCPAAKRACSRNTHEQEADDLLDYLGDRVSTAVATTGKVPPIAAAPTPTCCDQGGRCDPDPSVWAQPGWQQLAFSIDDPYRFSYQYTPDPSGNAATVRATADLGCDGHTTTVELKLLVIIDSSGTRLRRTVTHSEKTDDD